MTDSPGVAISLFSGAGGLDLGAEQAGFAVKAAVEYDRDAALTMEKNFLGLVSPVIQADILSTPTDQILEAAGLGGGVRPDLLIGAGRPARRSASAASGWSGSGRASIRTPPCSRSTPGCCPRPVLPGFLLESVYALTYDNSASCPSYERLQREIAAAVYQFMAPRQPE